MKGIRYPVMEEKEFVSVVLDRNILSKKECFNMMKYFNSVLTTPVGFLGESRGGHRSNISRFTSINFGWNYGPGFNVFNAIRLSVDRSIMPHSVRLFGSKNSEYSVNFALQDAERVTIVSEKRKFLSELIESEIGEFQGFEIDFKHPVVLQKNSWYYFHTQITGPPSYYGQNGQLTVQYSGVTFSFRNPDRGPTNVLKGQFPVFIFTLA